MDTPLRDFPRSVVGYALAPQRTGEEDRTPDLGNMIPTRGQLRSNPPKTWQHLEILQGALRALDILTHSPCFLLMRILCCIPLPFWIAALVRGSNCEGTSLIDGHFLKPKIFCSLRGLMVKAPSSDLSL